MPHLLHSRFHGSALFRLIVLGNAIILSACATLGRPRQAVRSPVPDWIAKATRCDRAKLDDEWKTSRYDETENDSACVYLGRWGRPSIVDLRYYLDSGRDVTTLQLSWESPRVPHTMIVNASASASGTSEKIPNYFMLFKNPPAPPRDTSHAGVVVGSVFDELGYPLPRPVTVCAEHGYGDGPSDPPLGCTTSINGTFRLEHLPIATVSIWASCETNQYPSRHKKLWNYGNASAARKPGTVVLLVKTFGCDPRPLRIVSRVFRGRWSRGFKESAFSACLNDSWQAVSDTSGTDRRMEPSYAWVDSMPTSGTNKWLAKLNGAAEDGHGGQVSYVEWHATVTGPDRYGPGGSSSFRMVVDSVVTMRAPSAEDCR